MAMSNPPHPGRSIRENCLKPLGLNVTEAAQVLGVPVTLCRECLMGMQRSLRKWRFGWKRQAGPMPSFGCGAKPPTISCRCGRIKTGSMSNDTGRNPPYEHPVVSSSQPAFRQPFETGH